MLFVFGEVLKSCHTAVLAATQAAIMASVVDRAMHVCFLLDQVIDPPRKKNMLPDVELLSSMSPAKSASENLVIH